MSSRMKIGVLIQGPMSSIGRNGISVNIPFFKLKAEDIIQYDTTNDVNSILDFCEKLFMLPCLVTKDIGLAKQKITRPCKIIDNSEDFSYYKERYPSLDKINHVGHNKYRQFNSLFKSLDFFESNNVTHILKIRTDSPIDLNEFDLYIKKMYRNQKLVLPFIHKFKPFFFEDFFFFIKIEDARVLCENFLFGPEVAESVHLHFHLIFREFCCPDGNLKIPLYVNQDSLDIQKTNRCLMQFVSVFHQKIFDSMFYRGKKIQYLTTDSKSKSNERIFFEDYDTFLNDQRISKKIFLKSCINSDFFANYIFKYRKDFLARKNLYYLIYRNLHKLCFFPCQYIKSIFLYLKYNPILYK